jgi:hypothetical protein
MLKQLETDPELDIMAKKTIVNMWSIICLSHFYKGGWYEKRIHIYFSSACCHLSPGVYPGSFENVIRWSDMGDKD